MRWALCGLTFALAVTLAVGTAAIRAGNIRLRHELERQYRAIDMREVELRRLSVLAVEQQTPERLADLLRLLIEAPPASAAGGATAEAATTEALSWQ